MVETQPRAEVHAHIKYSAFFTEVYFITKVNLPSTEINTIFYRSEQQKVM